MTGIPSSRNRRVTVRLSGDDLAALPQARTISEALRRVLETQRERANGGAPGHDLGARLDRLEHTLACVLAQQSDAVPVMIEAADGAPRAVRIEGFLFAIGDALTRSLVKDSAARSSIERHGRAVQGERGKPAAHSVARRTTRARSAERRGQRRLPDSPRTVDIGSNRARPISGSRATSAMSETRYDPPALPDRVAQS